MHGNKLISGLWWPYDQSLAKLNAALPAALALTGSGLDLEPETEVTKLRMARRT
jgi:hypothetical protein